MISEYKMYNRRIINYNHTICDRLHGYSITGIHISRIITSLLVTNTVPGKQFDRLLTECKPGGGAGVTLRVFP